MAQLIRVAHSPDSDDAFMFYALARHAIDTGDLNFEHELHDIETLNQRALEGRYEVTAVSFHAYAYLADRYALLPHGASIGDGYGPIVVARSPLGLADLAGAEVASPGPLTTAALVARLAIPEVRLVSRPFDRIGEEVLAGKFAAGIIIHEGQLTYAEDGLSLVADFGDWWKRETGLPLPLGGNVIRRDLEPGVARRVSRLLGDSIEHGLAHRGAALGYALEFARGLDAGRADRFVGMYVNDFTRDYGERGREAVARLLDMAHERGLIPHRVPIEYVE